MIRIFRHYVPRTLVWLGLAEALTLFLSLYLGVLVRFGDFDPTQKLMVGSLPAKAAVYTAVMMTVMSAMGLYQRGLRDEFRGVVFRLSAAFVVGLLLMLTLSLTLPEFSLGTTAFGATLVASGLGLVAVRYVIYQFADSEKWKRRVIVLGAASLARQVEALRRKTDRYDVHVVGYIQEPGVPVEVFEGGLIPNNSSMRELVEEHDIDEIVMALEKPDESAGVADILDCKMAGVHVIDVASFIERQTGRLQLDALKPRDIIFADGFVQAVLKGIVHRLFDLVLASIGLFLTWPIMLVTAAAILLESHLAGPVLYRQVRVGRNGRLFEIVKFRSMRTDAESRGAQYAQLNDTRVTRVGGVIRKTRIDELPQLFNVLKGDMSFVGPRPERPEFVEQLSRKIRYYDLRHRVKPGITGWAQICYPYGASDTDAKRKLQFDLYYIKNYSLFLDITILIQTAQVILWGKGAR